MQWPAGMRVQRLRRAAARECRAALVELDQRALDLLRVRLLGERRQGNGQQRQESCGSHGSPSLPVK
jgi:hypothetical protein